MATGEATLERLRFNKSGSKLVGPDSDSLREQLQSFMKQNIMKDSDFYNLLVMPLVRGGVTEKLTKEVFIGWATLDPRSCWSPCSRRSTQSMLASTSPRHCGRAATEALCG